MKIKDHKIYRYKNRDVVLIQDGDTNQPFYRSTGRNSGMEGIWFPFNGIARIVDRPWFVKDDIIVMGEDNKLEVSRFGCERFKEISEWLGGLDLDTGVEGTEIEINGFLGKENLNELFWRNDLTLGEDSYKV